MISEFVSLWATFLYTFCFFYFYYYMAGCAFFYLLYGLLHERTTLCESWVLIDCPSGQYGPTLFARDCFVQQETFCFDHIINPLNCPSLFGQDGWITISVVFLLSFLRYASALRLGSEKAKENLAAPIFSYFDFTHGVRSCLFTKSRLSSNWRYPLWRQGAFWSSFDRLQQVFDR